MRSSKAIERALKRADLNVEINTETDRAIVRELAELHGKTASCGPRRGRLGYMALAAAVAIVVAAALLWNRRQTARPEDRPRPAAMISAAEMLTVGQLRAAYQRGGFAALEAQCQEAADKVDVKSETLSMGELIVELEGR